MGKPIPLTPGQYFHVFNRGNNGENIFLEKRNYVYFLHLYLKYITPIADTFAYCLMRNHFHLLIRIHNVPDGYKFEDWQAYVSLQYGNLFSTYTKAINLATGRHGSLFEKPFKRILVSNERYFANLVRYIHQNPQAHGFVDDFRDWHWSSYDAMLTTKATSVKRDVVIEWFGGQDEFVTSHDVDIDADGIRKFVDGDWFD